MVGGVLDSAASELASVRDENEMFKVIFGEDSPRFILIATDEELLEKPEEVNKIIK